MEEKGKRGLKFRCLKKEDKERKVAAWYRCANRRREMFCNEKTCLSDCPPAFWSRTLRI